MFKIINPISGRLLQTLSYKRKGLYFILFFAFIGFLLTVTQLFGQSPDYLNYEIFFDDLRSAGVHTVLATRFEPGFSLVALVLTSFFTSNALVYSLIAFASMLLKAWAIRVYASNQIIFLLIALFYFSRFFSLHELTQLRAAVAIGFLMIAAIFLWYGNRLYSILACTAALMFHMSAAALIPVLFLRPTRLLHAVAISLGIFGLMIVTSNFAVVFLAKYIEVLAAYQKLDFFLTIAPNPFSIGLLLDWTMIIASLIVWSRLTLLMRHIVFLQMVGMAIFYGALDLPAITHRLRELYSVFWVFFIADGLRLKSMRIPTTGFALVSIGFYSYLFIFSGYFFQ